MCGLKGASSTRRLLCCILCDADSTPRTETVSTVFIPRRPGSGRATSGEHERVSNIDMRNRGTIKYVFCNESEPSYANHIDGGERWLCGRVSKQRKCATARAYTYNDNPAPLVDLE